MLAMKTVRTQEILFFEDAGCAAHCRSRVAEMLNRSLPRYIMAGREEERRSMG